jgi:hypothetical protein
MTEPQQVSSLIGEIYDAALDPDLWPGVLEKACRFVGGVACNLYSEDSAAKTGNIHYTWCVDRHYGRLYYDKYIKFNPFTTAQLFFDVEQVISVGDIAVDAGIFWFVVAVMRAGPRRRRPLESQPGTVARG